MENILEQQESIAFLNNVKIVPQKAYAKILEQDGTKYVLRQYKMEELEGGYNMINISYALNIDRDLITFYSVYATSDKTDDTICLCHSQDNMYNTLFDNILSLEQDVWKKCLAKEKNTSYDLNKYQSLMFEVDSYSYSCLMDIIYEKTIFSALLEECVDYINVNKVVPKLIWQKFLSNLTKLSII